MQGWAPRVLVLRGQLVPDSLVIAALLEQRLRAQHEFVRLEEGVAHGFVADKVLAGEIVAINATTAIRDRDEASIGHEKGGRARTCTTSGVLLQAAALVAIACLRSVSDAIPLHVVVRSSQLSSKYWILE